MTGYFAFRKEFEEKTKNFYKKNRSKADFTPKILKLKKHICNWQFNASIIVYNDLPREEHDPQEEAK